MKHRHMLLSPRNLHAAAKINLCLHVTGRQGETGYHSLESLVVFAQWGDKIFVEPCREGDTHHLEIQGPHVGCLDSQPEKNLIFKALHVVESTYGHLSSNLRIRLVKNIPVAAGLGGGSADAAAILRYLRPVYAHVTEEQWLEICTNVGADVPMCYYSRPCIARGIGEKLSFIETMPPMDIVLIMPKISIKTAEIFAKIAHYDQKLQSPAPFLSPQEVCAYSNNHKNTLQQYSERLYPDLRTISEILCADPNVKGWGMCGSGSSYYAIYEKNPQNLMDLMQDTFQKIGIPLSCVRTSTLCN